VPLDFGVATALPLVAFSGKVSKVVLIKRKINVSVAVMKIELPNKGTSPQADKL
jgi:hypothetical protein